MRSIEGTIQDFLQPRFHGFQDRLGPHGDAQKAMKLTELAEPGPPSRSPGEGFGVVVGNPVVDRRLGGLDGGEDLLVRHAPQVEWLRSMSLDLVVATSHPFVLHDRRASLLNVAIRRQGKRSWANEDESAVRVWERQAGAPGGAPEAEAAG